MASAPGENDEDQVTPRFQDDEQDREYAYAVDCPRPDTCSKPSFKKGRCWSFQGADVARSYVQRHLMTSGLHKLSADVAARAADETIIKWGVQTFAEREEERRWAMPPVEEGKGEGKGHSFTEQPKPRDEGKGHGKGGKKGRKGSRREGYGQGADVAPPWQPHPRDASVPPSKRPRGIVPLTPPDKDIVEIRVKVDKCLLVLEDVETKVLHSIGALVLAARTLQQDHETMQTMRGELLALRAREWD